MKSFIIFTLVLATSSVGLRGATFFNFASAPTSTDLPLSLGIQFTANTEISVTSLGYYDFGDDGFLSSHLVGIFDSNGVLLGSTTLAAGTGATLVGDFRYQTIAPIILSEGETYVMAATTNGNLDPWAYGVPGTTITGFSVDPAITISPNAALFLYQADNILRDPTNTAGYTIYAGPNVMGDAVPEPATGSLMGMPLLAFFLHQRRRAAA